jgi:hypothetical protein
MEYATYLLVKLATTHQCRNRAVSRGLNGAEKLFLFKIPHQDGRHVTRCILLDNEREQVPVLEQPTACKIKSLNWIENYQVTRLLLPIDHNIATSSSMTLNWWESSYKFLSSPLIKVFPYTDISITCNMKLDNPVVEIQKEILRKERHTWGS